MDDLKGKTLTGLFWSLLERAGVRAVQFVIGVVLARLLAPEQFGLIGMLSLFLALAQIFLDSGFGAALIQKKDATHLDECSIFYLNIGVGTLFTVVLCLMAPLIAGFFKQPILTPLTRFLTLDILISAFGLIQITILTRRMQFGALIKANLLAITASGVIGVALAYRGFGVWSLAVQTIACSLIRTVTLWLVCAWRPSRAFSLASLKNMFGFGSRLLASGLVAAFFQNLYQVFIGKVFAASALGYYTRAFSMKTIVVETTGGALSRVMYPALAAIQDDLPRLQRAYRKSMTLVTFLYFPLMVGLAVVARPLIILVFSAKWEACVPFFQLMCASGLLYPLQAQNLEVLKVRGRSDLFFRLEIVKRAILVASILLTYRWGIAAMLTGDVVVCLIAYWLNSVYSGRLIGYPMGRQVMDVLPAFMMACLMGAGMVLAGLLLPDTHAVVLLSVQTGAGVLLYLGLSLVSKSAPLREIAGYVAQAQRYLPLISERRKRDEAR